MDVADNDRERPLPAQSSTVGGLLQMQCKVQAVTSPASAQHWPLCKPERLVPYRLPRPSPAPASALAPLGFRSGLSVDTCFLPARPLDEHCPRWKLAPHHVWQGCCTCRSPFTAPDSRMSLCRGQCICAVRPSTSCRTGGLLCVVDCAARLLLVCTGRAARSLCFAGVHQ